MRNDARSLRLAREIPGASMLASLAGTLIASRRSRRWAVKAAPALLARPALAGLGIGAVAVGAAVVAVRLLRRRRRSAADLELAAGGMRVGRRAPLSPAEEIDRAIARMQYEGGSANPGRREPSGPR